MKTIPVKAPRGVVFQALIDDEDYERLAKHKWFATKRHHRTYAFRNGGGGRGSRTPSVMMHDEILGIKDGFTVDHRNFDGLDNQRHNLRFANASQQAQNGSIRKKSAIIHSRFKGVCWDKANSKWRASITFNGKQKCLGRFRDERLAAEAYDSAAVSLFGEFAAPNFVNSELNPIIQNPKPSQLKSCQE